MDPRVRRQVQRWCRRIGGAGADRRAVPPENGCARMGDLHTGPSVRRIYSTARPPFADMRTAAVRFPFARDAMPACGRCPCLLHVVRTIAPDAPLLPPLVPHFSQCLRVRLRPAEKGLISTPLGMTFPIPTARPLGRQFGGAERRGVEKGSE